MRTNRINNEPSARSSFSTDLSYTTDNPRFDIPVTHPTTMAMVGLGGYSVFISTGGGRTGSYSMTSRQESYLSLNSSFTKRVKGTITKR